MGKPLTIQSWFSLLMYTHLNFAGEGTVAPQKRGQSLYATAATHGVIQNLLKTVARLAKFLGPLDQDII